MSIEYKFNVLDALKEAGWSSYKLIHDNMLPSSTVQRLRENKTISMESLDKICEILQMQPGEIIKHV